MFAGRCPGSSKAFQNRWKYGGKHRCYAWVGVHSGHGGGVEADHFDYALDGARGALRYLAPDHHTLAMQALHQGFRAFERDHARFFAIA